MSRDIIPHEAPGSPSGTPKPIDHPKEAGLTWNDFHPEPHGPRLRPPRQNKTDPKPEWQRVSDELEDLRARFIKQNPVGWHPRCSNVDRSTVLAVYNEALVKLEHATRIVAIRINLEVRKKVATVLGLREAAPRDQVFYTKGAFLKPLEPQYAQPALHYYNRVARDGDDSHYRSGIKRLRAWRKGGWPEVYPEEAVERERREKKRRARMSPGQVRVDDLRTVQAADPLDWGEEVDADPDRPWK